MSDLFQFTAPNWVLALPVLLIIAYLGYAWYENASRTPDQDQASRLPIFNRTICLLWSLAAVSVLCWLVAGGNMG